MARKRQKSSPQNLKNQSNTVPKKPIDRAIALKESHENSSLVFAESPKVIEELATKGTPNQTQDSSHQKIVQKLKISKKSLLDKKLN
ncbi:MAG: hypothetical protein HC820_02325 [Hydrococcus sp. RM1_1_31]|nr:hypothetical protein [Hydrococcus sp. RM1_1_31]